MQPSNFRSYEYYQNLVTPVYQEVAKHSPLLAHYLLPFAYGEIVEKQQVAPGVFRYRIDIRAETFSHFIVRYFDNADLGYVVNNEDRYEEKYSFDLSDISRHLKLRVSLENDAFIVERQIVFDHRVFGFIEMLQCLFSDKRSLLPEVSSKHQEYNLQSIHYRVPIVSYFEWPDLNPSAFYKFRTPLSGMIEKYNNGKGLPIHYLLDEENWFNIIKSDPRLCALLTAFIYGDVETVYIESYLNLYCELIRRTQFDITLQPVFSSHDEDGGWSGTLFENVVHIEDIDVDARFLRPTKEGALILEVAANLSDSGGESL